MTARSPDNHKSRHGTPKPASGSAAESGMRPRGESSDPAQQLAQKDELIQALTEQLEQAAEQLDRLQRSGADRRRGPAGTMLPGALVDDQKRVVEDLQRVVQQWEDMQAALTLGRIEMQISEIRDLIAEGNHGSNGFAALRQAGDGVVIHEEPAELNREEPHDEGSSNGSGNSQWEALKSQLLEGDAAAEEADDAWSALEQPLPIPPEAFDVAAASHDELVKAIDERDEYITMVLAQLRRIEVLHPAAEIAKLDVNSADFAQRVQTLERRLQQHLRCAEVEMSVERAKIARDRMQMAQQQEMLDRQLKKLGLNSIGDIQQAMASGSNVQERRWARFLGRPKND